MREDPDQRLCRVAHHVLQDDDGVTAGTDLSPFLPSAEELAHLLLQSHDGVHPEVATLTGIGDTDGSGKEEPSSQDLKAAPAG